MDMVTEKNALKLQIKIIGKYVSPFDATAVTISEGVFFTSVSAST